MFRNIFILSNFKTIALLFKKKDALQLIYILLFTFINIFFELLGIGLIIPLLEVLLVDNENSFFFKFFNQNLGFNYTRENLLFYLLTLFFLSFIIKNLVVIYINYLLTLFRFSIMSELSNKIYTNYLKKDFNFFINSKKISLVKDVIEESNNVSQNIIFQLLNIISDFLIIFSIMFFLFYSFVVETTFLIIYFALTTIVYYYFVKKKLLALGALRYEQLENRYQSLLDGFSSFIQIKLTGTQSNFLSKFKVFNENFFKTSLKYSVYQFLPKYLFEISFAAMFIIMIFTAKNVEYSFNDLIILLSVYSVAGLKLLPSLSRIFVSLQSISYAIPTLEKFKLKLNDHEANENKDNTIINFKKNIIVKNLHFSYPNKQVLQNINFEIKKGSITGFRGISGSGKSTLFYILLGLIKKDSGLILVDDKNIDLNSSINWKKKIGYLGPNTYLLDETIKQNIIFSKDEKIINNENLKESIKFSELDSLIDELPKGLDTHLGDDGAKISTGQKQRIGLARLFFSDKPMIFLDEATNSLDKETEKKIFKNLRSLNKDTTKFIISHNNNNLDLCDNVIDIK